MGGTLQFEKTSALKQGSPASGILMPDDLRWSWCNNNRNKVCNKCNAFELPPPHFPVHWKIVFHEIGPWCWKLWGPRCSKPFLGPSAPHPHAAASCTFSVGSLTLLPFIFSKQDFSSKRGSFFDPLPSLPAPPTHCSPEHHLFTGTLWAGLPVHVFVTSGSPSSSWAGPPTFRLLVFPWPTWCLRLGSAR